MSVVVSERARLTGNASLRTLRCMLTVNYYYSCPDLSIPVLTVTRTVGQCLWPLRSQEVSSLPGDADKPSNAE